MLSYSLLLLTTTCIPFTLAGRYSPTAEFIDLYARDADASYYGADDYSDDLWSRSVSDYDVNDLLSILLSRDLKDTQKMTALGLAMDAKRVDFHKENDLAGGKTAAEYRQAASDAKTQRIAANEDGDAAKVKAKQEEIKAAYRGEAHAQKAQELKADWHGMLKAGIAPEITLSDHTPVHPPAAKKARRSIWGDEFDFDWEF